MIFTFAGDDADFATAIAIEDFAAKGFFQDFSFAGKQHLGADNHGFERNIADVVGSAEFREEDGGLGIGHHILWPIFTQNFDEAHHRFFADRSRVKR